MPQSFDKLVDLKVLKRLFDAFYSATGISASIVALDGEILIRSRWQRICVDFHRRHPETEALCIQSDTQTQRDLSEASEPKVFQCPHGLIDAAIPIIIDGIHMANLFTGQFLFTPLDGRTIAQFRNQARQWRFDEKAYIEALLDVPIVPKHRIEPLLQYLKQFAELIGEMGISRLKQKQSETAMGNAHAALEREIERRERDTNRLTEILDGNPIPTFVINASGKVTHWNHACELLTHLPADDVIGTDRHRSAFYDHPHDLLADILVKDAGINELARLYGSKCRSTRMENDGFENEDFFPKLGENGKWLFFTAVPLKDANGTTVGAIETILDVTGRKLAEHGIRTSEARYRQLFDSANDGIFVLRDGIVIDCNQKALELFNISREEAIGQSAENFSPEIQPDGQPSISGLQKRRELVNQGVRQSFDWRFFRKDGSSFDAEISVTRSMINDVPHTLAVVRDITERKKMVLALKEREKELEEKSRYMEKINQALKASLDHREIEKRAVEENMMINLKRFVFPYLQELGNCSINTDARAYLSIIETNLNDIVSRVSKTVFWKYQDLTPTEVQIADLIRSGKNTKGIAQMLGLSPSSIQWHRKNIREKLGLTNKKVNLQTYLTSLTA